MARLLVRVTDNFHPTDPSLDPLRSQVGDVICVTEDKHEFSYGELFSGEYQVIEIPGVKAEALAYLCEHVEDDTGKITQVRTTGIDLKAADEIKLPEYTKEIKEVIDGTGKGSIVNDYLSSVSEAISLITYDKKEDVSDVSPDVVFVKK